MEEATYSIHGDICDADVEQLTRCLEPGPWHIRLGNDDELLLRDDRLEMSIYVNRAGSRCKSNFLVSAVMDGTIEEVREVLRRIADLLAAQGIIYNFEFLEEDGSGDEQIIRHPDF